MDSKLLSIIVAVALIGCGGDNIAARDQVATAPTGGAGSPQLSARDKEEILDGIFKPGQSDGESEGSRDWRISSWKAGTFTIEHEGRVYIAGCDEEVKNNFGDIYVTEADGSGLRSDVRDRFRRPFKAERPTCDIAVELVGRSIQTSEGLRSGEGNKEPDGWIITMSQQGSSLALSRWRANDEYMYETLKITSVDSQATRPTSADRPPLSSFEKK